jgi:hypothetical protein
VVYVICDIGVEKNTIKGKILGQNDFPCCQRGICDKPKLRVWGRFCKFAVLHLQTSGAPLMCSLR